MSSFAVLEHGRENSHTLKCCQGCRQKWDHPFLCPQWDRLDLCWDFCCFLGFSVLCHPCAAPLIRTHVVTLRHQENAGIAESVLPSEQQMCTVGTVGSAGQTAPWLCSSCLSPALPGWEQGPCLCKNKVVTSPCNLPPPEWKKIPKPNKKNPEPKPNKKTQPKQNKQTKPRKEN